MDRENSGEQECSRRCALVRFTAELLIAALHLPVDTQITGAREVGISGWGGFDVELRVEHPELKDVPCGHAVPRAQPRFRRQDEIVFEGWGQE